MCVCERERVCVCVHFIVILRRSCKQVIEMLMWMSSCGREKSSVLFLTIFKSTCSSCSTFFLQPVAWSSIVRQPRSHTNVWTLVPFVRPERLAGPHCLDDNTVIRLSAVFHHRTGCAACWRRLCMLSGKFHCLWYDTTSYNYGYIYTLNYLVTYY